MQGCVRQARGQCEASPSPRAPNLAVTTTMSSNTDASILDEALACIGQRIVSILIQPVDEDKNYITGLHNEVVGLLMIKRV